METINSIIEMEKDNLEEANLRLASLKGKWFKFGKKELVEFLKIYIKKKEKFIEELIK